MVTSYMYHCRMGPAAGWIGFAGVVSAPGCPTWQLVSWLLMIACVKLFRADISHSHSAAANTLLVVLLVVDLLSWHCW